jgi:hypothetical protein
MHLSVRERRMKERSILILSRLALLLALASLCLLIAAPGLSIPS